jgi:hypothetical protein
VMSDLPVIRRRGVQAKLKLLHPSLIFDLFFHPKMYKYLFVCISCR